VSSKCREDTRLIDEARSLASCRRRCPFLLARRLLIINRCAAVGACAARPEMSAVVKLHPAEVVVTVGEDAIGRLDRPNANQTAVYHTHRHRDRQTDRHADTVV